MDPTIVKDTIWRITAHKDTTTLMVTAVIRQPMNSGYFSYGSHFFVVYALCAW